MATITFEGYMGATPAWTDLGTNRLVFSGSLTDLSATIQATQFQDGTHAGSGTPGTDQCGTNHMNNVKWISDTQMSVNGGATETIDDTNLADTECTLRIHFNDTTAYSIQNGEFWSDDGTTETNPAEGVDIAAYEKSNTTQWQHINDYSTTGATGWQSGSIGGRNAGAKINMGNRATAATDQYWYYALSASPETAGSKANVRFGCYLEYY